MSAAKRGRCHAGTSLWGGVILGTRPSLAGRTQAGPFGIKFLISGTGP